jgi:hypothetical protein
MSALVLERKSQPDETPTVGTFMITPPIDEGYWSYRVRLGDGQALVGFPKFFTVGIGFAVEDDWNTNLPYNCTAEEICEHIRHNRLDLTITDAEIIEGIKLIQEAIDADAVAS